MVPPVAVCLRVEEAVLVVGHRAPWAEEAEEVQVVNHEAADLEVAGEEAPVHGLLVVEERFADPQTAVEHRTYRLQRLLLHPSASSVA